MAKTLTSRLVMEVIDRVTGPARAMSRSILGISEAVRGANGGGNFGDRLAGAIDRNNAALDGARGRLFDAAAGFYALRAAISSPIREAAAFEAAMADVRKVVDFATEKEFTDFRDGLMALSRQVPYTVNDLAAIAAAAGQAGIEGEELVRFTEAASKIGTAFDISADEAGDNLAKMMTALGITLDEAILLSDAMNHLSNAQASSAAEIQDVVRRVGAQATMFGFSAEQTAAFASAMISAGAESEVAATSFRNMGKALTRGASATDRQQAAFEALGLDAEDVAKRMQKDAVGTTVEVLEALSRIPKEQQAAISSDLFGDEARALGPLLTNLGLVRESLGLVGNESEYAGSSFTEFEKRSKTFEAQMQRFNNVLTALKITIGNALMPVLSGMMEAIAPIVDKVAEWVTNNPKLAAGLMAAAAGLIAFKVALAGLSFLGLMGKGAALSVMAAGFSSVGRAAGGLRAAAGAMVAYQTALATMSGAAGLTTLQKIGAAMRGMILAVPGVAMIGNGIAAIGAAIATISAPVWGTFALIAAAVAAVGGTIYYYWDRLSSIFSGVGKALGEILTPALEAAKPILDWFSGIGEVIAGAWQGVSDAMTAVGGFFGSFFEGEALSDEDKAKYEKAGYDTVMAFWNGMKQVFADLAAWVSQQVEKVLAPMREAAASIKGWWNGAGAPEGHRGVTSEGPPRLDGERAKGGPISRGRTYMVGEEGPELITASRSGYVNPNGSGGGGTTFNMGGITIHAAQGQSARQIAEEAAALIEEKVRAALRGIQADTGLSTY